MSDRPSGKVLLLSLAFGLVYPISLPLGFSAQPAYGADQAPNQSASAPPQATSGEATQAAEKAADKTSKAETEPDKKVEPERKKKQKREEEAAAGRHGKDGMSDNQFRHQDEGYYTGSKNKADQDRMSDNQRRHSDEGYYTEVKPYVPPPPELKPVAPPMQPPIATPPPLQIPPVGTLGPNDRKFTDDIGATGSITATRHAKQAREMLSSGHFDLAKSHFRESLQHVPDQLDLYPGYWESCAKTNDWGEARRALEKFFEMAPDKKKDWYWAYGETWFQLRNYDKAVPVLRESLGYGQHLDEVHGDLLKIALNRKDAAGIAQEYNAVLKTKPTDAKAQKDFGDWLELQGRHGEAMQHYKSAVGIDPSDGATAGRLAYMLMFYNKDFHGAIGYYQKAVAGDPLNAAKYLQSIEYAKSQIQTTGPKKKMEQQ